MKSIYIPRGESRSYDSLVTDYLVVDGHLQVTCGVKAKHISGRGVINAGSVSGAVVAADEIESATVICERLLAKRVSASEVFASVGAVVTCFLSAGYVETPKLTAALCEIDEVKAEKVIHLTGKSRGMLLTLLLSALRSFWVSCTAPRGKAVSTAQPEKTPQADGETAEDAAMRKKIAETVREVLARQKKEEAEDAEDFELKRIIGIFKLLRQQGYTLRIEPGAPEENAPIYDFGQEEKPAA